VHSSHGHDRTRPNPRRTWSGTCELIEATFKAPRGPWTLPQDPQPRECLPVNSTVRDTNRYGYPSRQPAEVLALLVDDGSAGAVASVAVQEAVARHAPVRFIQVMPPQLDDQARSIAEEAMFREGLHALRGHPRTHIVFEVLQGGAREMIRSRSRNAELLVVGDEQKSELSSLADQCLEASRCPVRKVPT
jgi:hypothetical protein